MRYQESSLNVVHIKYDYDNVQTGGYLALVKKNCFLPKEANYDLPPSQVHNLDISFMHNTLKELNAFNVKKISNVKQRTMVSSDLMK